MKIIKGELKNMIGLLEGGIIGAIIFIIIFLICLPSILTIIVGIGFANILGFTGLTWWAFIGLFYIIIMAILAYLGK